MLELTEPLFLTWRKIQAMWHGVDNTNANVKFNMQQTTDFMAVSDLETTVRVREHFQCKHIENKGVKAVHHFVVDFHCYCLHIQFKNKAPRTSYHMCQ